MKNDSMHRSKRKRNRRVVSRRGVILVSVLASLVLIINIISASFSWFSKQDVAGAGMLYSEKTYNRSEQCSFITYEGTKNATYSQGHYIDQIDYNTQVTSASIGSGQIKYFRTSIVNADTKYPSNVSLYFASLGTGDSTTGSNLTIAVTFPSNTVRIERGLKNDYCLMRNAYVKVHDTNDADGPGLLQVDWFIKNNGAGTVVVKMGPENNGGSDANMYLMYN